jgi:uncharacterized SAM-dependent methyltransferase
VGSLSPSETEASLSHRRGTLWLQRWNSFEPDLTWDVRALDKAYNDCLGIAAAFNLNILEGFSQELEVDFNLRWFQHRAFYDSQHGRTEMQLVSLRDQESLIDGLSIFLREYENYPNPSLLPAPCRILRA